MDESEALAARLRAATRAAHRALDHHPLLAPLVRAGLTPEAYGRALAALHAPQAALERLLAGFAPPADFPPRLPALEADLAALGLAPFPLAVPPPDLRDAAEKVGAMYVLEGATLGAAVIARELSATLPADTPRSFFSGAGGAARWPAFWRFARRHCPPPAWEAACAGASAAFACYRGHLDACRAARLAVSPAPTFA